MNKKSNCFGWLYILGVGVVLGFFLPNLNLKEGLRSSMEEHIESILERESFDLRGGLRREFISHLVSTANDYEFDPLLILAIMKVESAFNPSAVSFAGAYGLLQIKPVAAEEVATVFGGNSADAGDLFDPFVNVRVGVQYLSYLRDVVGRNPTRMLAAYNLGPTHVRRYGYNLRYAGKVLNAYRSFLKQADKV